VTIMMPRFQPSAPGRAGKRLPLILAVLLLLIAATYLLSSPVLAWFGDNLIIEEPLEKVDIIHVIAGADYRTDYGIRLYKEGYGKTLFFTGGWCAEHHRFHGEYGRERALKQGVPTEAIAIDDAHVMSTYAEVVRLREFITHDRRPVHAVIAVSDPYHMRRARWTYREVLGPGIRVIMAPVPFGMTPYNRRWWTRSESKELVEEEYLKIIYYHARYGLGWPFLSRWLASLDTK
jgi:uncharacterized SAM-binding protein YcdF (DUF218 family)